MGQYKDKKHEKFAKAFQALRADLRLTLRDASTYIGLSPSQLVCFERGEEGSIELVLGDTEIEVLCHRCAERYRRKPVLNVSFPCYVCPKCNSTMKFEGLL